MPQNEPGRPAGRPLTPTELRLLELLREVTGRASGAEKRYSAELEDKVLELRESGCSVRSIAEPLGVSATQVQRWTAAARARRSAD